MVVPGSRADDQGAGSPRRRWLPAHLGGYAYLAVLAAGAVGLWIVTTGDWRVGVRWMAAGLLGGAAVRLVLAERQAGMLAVRNRYVDAGALAAVGVALLLLASGIPEQPGM